MPSPAAQRYGLAVERSRILRRAALGRGVRRGPFEERQVYCQASLAAAVAAWEGYVVDTVQGFFAAIADPLAPPFSALHTVGQRNAEIALGRFNTPNWENSRDILARTTGYDPINDWTWTARTMSGPQVKERLNQILQVRHSFAHGFPIPAYPWTQLASGRVRLTNQALKDNEALFKNLVRRTDQGLQQHIQRAYGRILPW
jgi:hypothetical protein